MHAKADFIVPTRKQRMTDEEGFIVRHYAGDVVYHTAAIIGKSTGNIEVHNSFPPSPVGRPRSASVRFSRPLLLLPLHPTKPLLAVCQVPWTDKNNDTLQAEWVASPEQPDATASSKLLNLVPPRKVDFNISERYCLLIRH